MLGKKVLVEGLCSDLKDTLASLAPDITMEVIDDVICVTVRACQKMCKIALPRREYPLTSVDVMLFDEVAHKKYVTYETELDASMLDVVILDLQVIVKRFLQGDYDTVQNRSFLGLVKTNALVFKINGVDHVYSEA